MALTILTIVQTIVLFTNAFYVLDEKEILSRFGFDIQFGAAMFAEDLELKNRAMNFIRTVRRLTTAPMVILNFTWIALLLLSS